MGRGDDNNTFYPRAREEEISPAAAREMDRLLGEWEDHQEGVLTDKDSQEDLSRVEKYLLALYEKDDQICLAAAEKTSWFELQTFAAPDDGHLQEIEEYLMRQGVAIEEWDDTAFVLSPDVDREEMREILLELEDEHFLYSEEIEEFFS